MAPVFLVVGLEEDADSARMGPVEPPRQVQVPQVVVLDLEAAPLGALEAAHLRVVVGEVVGMMPIHRPSHRRHEGGQCRSADPELRPAPAGRARDAADQRREPEAGQDGEEREEGQEELHAAVFRHVGQGGSGDREHGVERYEQVEVTDLRGRGAERMPRAGEGLGQAAAPRDHGRADPGQDQDRHRGGDGGHHEGGVPGGERHVIDGAEVVEERWVVIEVEGQVPLQARHGVRPEPGPEADGDERAHRGHQGQGQRGVPGA
ncbi:MAG TPA: hypothetical protein VMR21_00990, partial [Vicinamibacteria bacterium]|nr:hypothetical protein [Vicinamibacteria bacterium]